MMTMFGCVYEGLREHLSISLETVASLRCVYEHDIPLDVRRCIALIVCRMLSAHVLCAKLSHDVSAVTT